MTGAAVGGPAQTALAATWNLANGRVSLPDTFSCGAEQLSALEFVGAGGSGAVFAAEAAGSRATRVAVKVSWAGPAALGVQNEADVYVRLQDASIRSVPKLLAKCDYSVLASPPASGIMDERVVLILDPFVESAASNFEGLNPSRADRAASQLGVAVVAVLSAGIASTDVQVLIDPPTGELRLIDMSEATVLTSPPSFVQLAIARGFLAEAVAIVPSQQRLAFLRAAEEELERRRHDMDEELADALVEILSTSIHLPWNTGKAASVMPSH